MRGSERWVDRNKIGETTYKTNTLKVNRDSFYVNNVQNTSR